MIVSWIETKFLTGTIHFQSCHRGVFSESRGLSRRGAATQKLQPFSSELTSVDTNPFSAATADRYSTQIAQRITGGPAKSPKDQDLYRLIRRQQSRIQDQDQAHSSLQLKCHCPITVWSTTCGSRSRGTFPKQLMIPIAQRNLALSLLLYPRTRRRPSSLPFSSSSFQVCSFSLYGFLTPGPSSSL